ncbi:MAG TPA: GAF domain-containing protein, partial [Candidatus Acidoferrales bacterium]
TGEPVGALQLEAEANRAWTEAEVELVSSVARQVAQQVENLRLLAQAERSRAEAEQATRRLTRESWQDYLEHDAVSAQGYVYDLNQVAPLTPAPQGEATLALTWPLKVQGETIGELAVGELPEKLSDEAAELITAVSEQLSAHIENLRLTEQTGRALAQTEQQAAELRALFAAMPDVVLVYDEQGRYVKIAPTNPSLLYKPPEDMVGKTLAEVLPAPQAEAFMGYIRQVLDTRGTLNIEYSLPIGGQEVWFSATVTPLTANTVFWIARDITVRKQAEKEILKFKLGIERSTDAVFITDPQGTIVYVNPSFEKVYGYSREEALGQTPRLLKSGLVPLEGYKQFWATLLGKGVIAGEIVNKTKDGRLITIEGSNSPILDEAGNIVGFLAAHRDITERKQAEETLRRQHAYQGALQEITLGLIGRLELTDLLQNIITRAGELIGTTHGYIFLLEPDEAEMRMHVGTGTYNSLIDYRLKPGQAVVGTIWQTGEPLVIDDYQAWANRLHLKNLEAVRAVVGAPLKSGSQVVGVISLAYLEEGRRFGEDEVAVLSRFAQLASVALDNARLYAEAQQELTERKRAEAILDKRATELQTVAKVSTAASTILEARILLQNVVDLTKDNFGLYHTHIYLVDGPTGMLVLTAGAGEVGRRMVSEGRSIALSRMQSLVARAAREREAVIVNDVRAAPDFLPHPLLPDTRSEMAVPMIAGDQLLGVFDVQHDQPGYFSEEDVRIQTALAAQVAVALQNANLYAEQAAIVTRLRELDHLKSTFLANMSHELRTPLNSILGFTDVMIEGLDGPLTDLMESDLKVVQKNGKHLLNLINDVLDMAKIEAGKMSLSLERFNLQEVLEEVVEIIGPLARDKALDLRIATEPTDALDLTADRIRLRQVMINLVGNAIKFTEQGVITLQAMQHNGSVRVAIRDTGFGIPPDKLEAIFEAFSQVDTSTTRKAGGTGLGLPISRRLIELHGGRLWAESSGIPGEGSTFFVELPLEAQEVAV